MHELVRKLVAAGGTLVARSSYDCTTEDLDAVYDAETGRLSIAEFHLCPKELARQVIDATRKLAKNETLLIDLTGKRAKVQLLPVPGDHGIIVRNYDGLRRFPRSEAGISRYRQQWLARELTQGAPA
jgi:hypothetical protein